MLSTESCSLLLFHRFCEKFQGNNLQTVEYRIRQVLGKEGLVKFIIAILEGSTCIRNKRSNQAN